MAIDFEDITPTRADVNDYAMVRRGAAAPFTAALIELPVEVFTVETANRNLSNVATLQNLFTAGGVTLPVGRYLYDCVFNILNMSATSGNLRFQIVAGTAVLGAGLLHAVGVDNTTPSNANTQTGNVGGLATNASMFTAGTGTGAAGSVRGTFTVTTAGTVIPQIQLVTANAAVLQAQSYFYARRIGSHDVARLGTWA